MSGDETEKEKKEGNVRYEELSNDAFSSIKL